MLSTATHRDYQSYDFRRRYERRHYDADILFSTDGRVFQGTLKDISIGGAFIMAKHTKQLVEGAVITISVPFTDGRKHVKRSGRVLWKNGIGFAISFYP